MPFSRVPPELIALPHLPFQLWLAFERARQSAYATHRSPVILISGSTDQANLVILAMGIVRPGKSVRAKLFKNDGEESFGHVSSGMLRLFCSPLDSMQKQIAFHYTGRLYHGNF